jgi:hypothetical protein
MLYIINYPLVSSDFPAAANWMQFYITRGMNGLFEANARFGDSRDDWAAGMANLQTLLSAGLDGARSQLDDISPDARETLLEFLFPSSPRPIVLFLDYLQPYTAWYEVGSWDFGTRSHPATELFVPLENVTFTADKRVLANTRKGRLDANLDKGQARFGGARLTLGEVRFYDGENDYQLSLDHPESYSMALHLPARSGVLGEHGKLNSVFSKLFFELRSNLDYFKPVHLKPPHYGIWEVNGDKYQSP